VGPGRFELQGRLERVLRSFSQILKGLLRKGGNSDGEEISEGQ